jgi:hypothetical protein
MRSTEGR